MTVTQDYWSEESYSGESEPEAEPAPKAAATKSDRPDPVKKTAEPTKSQAKPAPKSSAPSLKGGQSTLMGFFKKK